MELISERWSQIGWNMFTLWWALGAYFVLGIGSACGNAGSTSITDDWD